MAVSVEHCWHPTVEVCPACISAAVTEGLKRAVSWVDYYLIMNLDESNKALLRDLKAHLAYEISHGPSTTPLASDVTCDVYIIPPEERAPRFHATDVCPLHELNEWSETLRGDCGHGMEDGCDGPPICLVCVERESVPEIDMRVVMHTVVMTDTETHTCDLCPKPVQTESWHSSGKVTRRCADHDQAGEP